MNSDLLKSVEQFNDSDIGYWSLYDEISKLPSISYNPWIGSAFGSILVGLSGVFPLLVIPIDGGYNITKGAGASRLKVLLSFAVGGLLGDVFLHLLPEAWDSSQVNGVRGEHPSMFCGMWVLTGLLVFTITEKVFSGSQNQLDEPSAGSVETSNGQSGDSIDNNNSPIKAGSSSSRRKSLVQLETNRRKHMSGYLNLMANVIDNFTHGLAVGGSFLLSPRVGILSTLAILIHEVPHEVGDFAILLRAGFSRLEAARAQLATASSSLVGAMAAIAFSGAADTLEATTSWILPFTSGGFLHIALVVVLPDLLQEKDTVESVKQLASLILGVAVMAGMTYISE